MSAQRITVPIQPHRTGYLLALVASLLTRGDRPAAAAGHSAHQRSRSRVHNELPASVAHPAWPHLAFDAQMNLVVVNPDQPARERLGCYEADKPSTAVIGAADDEHVEQTFVYRRGTEIDRHQERQHGWALSNATHLVTPGPVTTRRNTLIVARTIDMLGTEGRQQISWICRPAAAECAADKLDPTLPGPIKETITFADDTASEMKQSVWSASIAINTLKQLKRHLLPNHRSLLRREAFATDSALETAQLLDEIIAVMTIPWYHQDTLLDLLKAADAEGTPSND